MMVHDLEGGRRENLGAGELPFYSPSGHLLYQTGPTTYDLWALPFSLNELRAAGPAFPIARNSRHPTVSSDGTLTYMETPASRVQRLVWRDRAGNKLGTIGEPHQGEIVSLSLSPDGRRVAVDADENGRDVWIHEVERPVKMRVTKDAAIDGLPEWSPKGDRIVFSSIRKNLWGVYVVGVDGSEEPVPLIEVREINMGESAARIERFPACNFLLVRPWLKPYGKKAVETASYPTTNPLHRPSKGRPICNPSPVNRAKRGLGSTPRFLWLAWLERRPTFMSHTLTAFSNPTMSLKWV